MKAAVLSSTGGLGLQGLLLRAGAKRPFVVIARRLTAQAQAGGALVEWVQRNEGQVQGVAVQQFDGEGEAAGFGLKALQDCRAGATLIALPQRCHLTYDAGSTDPRLLALIDQVPQELWGAKLALQLLAHRAQGEASPFATYIANLPVGVPGLPMFFNGEGLAALQYPPVTEQVKRRCRWLLSFSQQVLAPVRGTPQDPFEGATVDANALGWALAVVTSRAFRTRGPTQPAAMLPLIDMANHSFAPNCKIAAAGAGDLHMVAIRDVTAGEPILLSYGNLTNDFLLMDYGFVVPGNHYDTVQLRFDPGLIEAAKSVAGVKSTLAPDAGPALPAWQQAPLRMLGLLGEGANTEVCIRRTGQPAGGPGGAAAAAAAVAAVEQQQPAGGSRSAAACPVDARLLAAVRILCAKNAGEVSTKSAQQQLGVWDEPLSQPSEVAALRTLSGLFLIALSQFTTSLPEDQQTLEAGGTGAQGASQQGQEQGQQAQQAQQQWQPLSPDMRLALQFRTDKKQLLMDALDVLSARVKELLAEPGAAAAAGPSKTGKGRVPAGKQGGKGFGA